MIIMNTFWNIFLMADSLNSISLNPSAISSNEPQQGKWNDRQNATYIAFLQFNKNIFKRKQKRRVYKFYKQMSSFIKTRTPVQCRSHHQKLESKYKYPNRIISSYKENQDLTLYEEQKLKFEVVSMKNQGKQLIIQNNIQSESLASQTDIQSTSLQFVRAEDYFQKQRFGLQTKIPITFWSPVYYYSLPFSNSYGIFKGDQLKEQQLATNSQASKMPKVQNQKKY